MVADRRWATTVDGFQTFAVGGAAVFTDLLSSIRASE
jgi:hypothetical protein